MIGIDLFAGAGGMSLGATAAEIPVSFAVELDPFAAKTYAANHPTTKLFHGDISDVTENELLPWAKRPRDLIVFGGPPCQGFSWSNLRTRNLRNRSNWLFKQFMRVVAALKPAWVVFENVQGIVNTATGTFLEQITNDLTALGYRYRHALLNAVDFGVPQDRTRFFLVGFRTARDFQFPKSANAKRLTVHDAVCDLPRLKNGDSVSWREYGSVRPSPYGTRMRRNLIGSCNHLVSANSELVVRRYKHVRQGGNWEDIPPSLMRNYADRSRCHTGIYHRLKAAAPSVVIGNFRKNMLIHPTQNRGLSIREAARIQSFPDDYTFHGSIGFQQQQVGNAVPPLLATAVFEAIVAQA